ncbi:MAG: FtsX-like permease family protein, partial [Bacteroidota bacterium]
RQEARLSAVTYHVQPVPAIHLYSSRPNEIALNGQATYVYLFGLAALCVLLIACINFMNLMTARSAQRAKEVGMRKALGAHRTQLVRQFLGEATVQTFVGALLALGLIALLLPAFNLATGKALTFGQFVSGPMLLLIAGLVLGVGALAGSYPAFVLSAFRPVSVLRGSVEGPAAARIRLRKGLVVFQFAISSLLLIGTVVVYQQLMYMQSANLGFDKEHVVVVRLRDQENQQAYNSLKQAWLQHPHVETVSGTSAVPGYDGLYEFLVVPQDDARVDSVRVRTLSVDADFTEALGLNVVQGRDFMEAAPADQNGAFLINEAMARQFGWTQPVGNELRLDFHLRGTSTKYGEVVGLVRDFHYTSMHSVVEPIIIHLVPPSYYIDYLVVRVQPGAIMETMGFLEDEWRAFSPSRPFDYTFLDAEFEALYRNEARLSRVFAGMAGLAIFVACLGLFGLAAYTAQQRTKEIGVRKVIGASTPHLVLLLAGDFIKLVLVAFALAAPVAFLLMQRWLQDFAYHVDLGVSHFALASALIVTVALLTVGYQTIRAALMDPVRALKYE